jgi:hypothetical protein
MRGAVGVVGFTLFAGLSRRNSLPDMDSFLLLFICASLVVGVVFGCGSGEDSLPAAEVRALIWERGAARLLKLAM